MSARKILLAGLWSFTALVAAGVVTMAHVLHSKDAPTAIQIASDVSTTDLPVLFDSPGFSLTDENGKTFDSGQLRGKVWVADFVFTHCATLCPMMTENMAQFQRMTPDSKVEMVSFSVDPENDTPAVLKSYGQNVHADESRWHFLTGTRAQTWEISKGMKLAVGPDKGDQIMHSSHFLLVDGAGRVRGIYDYDTPGVLKQLVADSEKLANQQ